MGTDSVGLLMLGLVIGSNNLAASLALGAFGQGKHWARILTVVAFFEFCIPLLGLWLGQNTAGFLAERAGWLGPALLAGIGLWTLFNALRGQDEDASLMAEKAATWGGMILLAGSLSIDNLLVGFGLGLGKRSPLLVASVIVCCSVAFTGLGLWLGSQAHERWRRRAEIAAAVMLLVLAGAAWLGWI